MDQEPERAGKSAVKLAQVMEILGLGTPAGRNTERASSAGGNGTPATDTHATAEPEAVLLVDACNGFNKLSRKAMIWTV